jgi:hypothetical protein
MKALRRVLKKILPPQQIQTLVRLRQLYYYHITARLHPQDLIRLVKIYGSDKWLRHYYITHYVEHFNRLRSKNLKILEIGVGGYRDAKKGGNSLRMWKRYFPKSTIYSIDTYDKRQFEEKRIKIFQGSQTDEVFLRNLCGQIGPLDIIIDDGSHICNDVLISFNILFPFLKSGGIYVVEDTQTSYWPDYGGNSENLNDCSTSMNFFKNLTDGLNYHEFLKPNYIPSYFERNIVAIHFYHNLVFIYKGENDEPSNKVENGKFK